MIKKHKSRNEYFITEDGIFVRNLCKEDVPSIDINKLILEKDCKLFLENAIFQKKLGINDFQFSANRCEDIVVVSDGYDFDKKQSVLEKLPRKVRILAVNGALKKWKCRRNINWYIVNNPYTECKRFLIDSKVPCVAATRTSSEFIKKYKGQVYTYYPTPNCQFTDIRNESHIFIDDYRNPVCAAIGIAHRMGGKRIMLFCCDDSFADERAAAEKLENGLWAYPQHIISYHIIDAIGHWLKEKEISIMNHSSGIKYINIPYIGQESLLNFFGETNG
jgi:hypothetical protein